MCNLICSSSPRHFFSSKKKLNPFNIIVLFFSLVLMSTGIVQADRPRSNTCENGSTGSCIDDALSQQVDLIDGVDDMINDMESVGLFSLVRSQTGVDLHPGLSERISTLRRENARAKAANDATSDDEYDEIFAQGDKEKKNSCKNSDLAFYNSLADDEYLPAGFSWVDEGNGKNMFGNGKCDIFEATDFDGNTVIVNELEANMCAFICKDKQDHNGASQQGKSKQRFNEGMIDSISSSRLANQMLTMQRARIYELGVLFSELQLSEGAFPSSITADGDVCLPAATGNGTENGYLVAEGVLQVIVTVVDAIVILTDIFQEVLETVSDVAHDACGQTAVGFNARAGCSPVTIAFHVVKGLNDVLKGANTAVGNAKDIVANLGERAEMNRADDAKACSKLIYDEFEPDGKITLLQDDITLLKSELSGMRAAAGDRDQAIQDLDQKLQQVMELIEINRQLLLTPAGLRDK